MSRLAKLAARAPAPVFPVVGRGARDAVGRLRLDPRIQLVDSPRRAAVLLVSGGLGERMVEATRRVHDQLPHPRATLHWTAGDRDRQQSALPGSPIVASSSPLRLRHTNW